MKRAALITLTLLLASGITYAMLLLTSLANGTVKGRVMELSTRDVVPGATIEAFIGKERKSAVASDIDGNYELSLPAGTYRLEIKAIGYETKITENVIVTDGKTTNHDIQLAYSKTLTEELIIDGTKTGGKDKSGSLGVSGGSGKVTETLSYSVGDAADDAAPPAPPADGYISTPTHAAPDVAYDITPTMTKSVDAVITSTPGVVATGATTISSSKVSKAPVYRSEHAKSSISKADKAYEPKTTVTESSVKKDMSVVKGKSTSLDIDKKTDVAVVREPDTKAGQLTAGEWSDNRNWDFYTGVRKKSDWTKMEPNWKFDLSRRYYVKVTSSGKPQNDVKVVLKDKKGNVAYEGRSDNNGNCYLFAGLFDKDAADGATIEVATSGGTKTLDAGAANNTRPISVDITRSGKVANKLDIMFMIDATGSMGDEIRYLKEELSDVVRRVKAESEQTVDIRVSANVYRDKGDEYVVRSFPFTNDMSKVLTDLNAQNAGGGGDFEEAVEEGLDDGINKHDWSDDATARLMFLVLDAPPHNTPENLAKIQKAVLNAAKKGIRIIPVTSSGIDKNTEFLMRFLSIATGGTYTFLTDHSGIGNSHIEPTIGKYDVEYLNNLMVRLIKAYLTTES